MSEKDDDKPTIIDVGEKLGILWLEDLHRKAEAIRSLQMMLVRTVDDISEDEALELVNRIEYALNILLEQEIRPVAENRDDWEIFREEAEKMLGAEGLLDLDPSDEAFFAQYLRYIDIVMGRIERFLEYWGMKVTPYPPNPDYVGAAWKEIVREARSRAERLLREAEQPWFSGTKRAKPNEPEESEPEEPDG